jgi:preprotein translocase subunit YajC
LPHLNETLAAVESLDGSSEWNVITLDSITPDIRVFKGPRFNSEPLIVEEPADHVEPYYTPSAILQEKSDSAKLLDVSRASAKQRNVIEAIRVRRGDIVITRSGSIGRVAYITKRFDGAIVSDDLIRVRISDEQRRLYVLAYLQSKFAQDQMLRNEYGAIQQHLEPEHVRNLLVPLPVDETVLANVATAALRVVETKELLDETQTAMLSGTMDYLKMAIREREAEVRSSAAARTGGTMSF